MKSHMAWLWVVAIIGAVIFTGCGPTVVTKYDAAKNQAEQGDHLAAIQTYNEFVAQNPDSPL